MKYTVTVSGRTFEATVHQRSRNSITFEINGIVHEVTVQPQGGAAPAPRASGSPRPRVPAKPTSGAQPRSGSGEVRAPMPGIVVQVIAKEGTTVSVGDPLIVIEAMKMENCLNATVAGKVLRIATEAGKQVNGGDLLIVIGE